MGLFLASFAIMALAALGMAVGVLAGRRELKGSCGGLNAVDGDCPCGRSESCEPGMQTQESSGRWTP